MAQPILTTACSARLKPSTQWKRKTRFPVSSTCLRKRQYFLSKPQWCQRIGVGFGVHVDIPPEFGNVAVLSMEHPPMGPNAVTHETWVSQYNAGQINYNGFTFEYDYELEPGVWTLSSSMNGRKIYEVEFNVIDASLMPGLTCDGAFLS